MMGAYCWTGLVHSWRWKRKSPHDGGLQSQAQAAAAGSASEEALQALGADVAKGDGLAPEAG